MGVKQSVRLAGEVSQLLSPKWPFQEPWGPDPEFQGFYHAKEGLCKHSCVTGHPVDLGFPESLGLHPTEKPPTSDPRPGTEKGTKGCSTKIYRQYVDRGARTRYWGFL